MSPACGTARIRPCNGSNPNWPRHPPFSLPPLDALAELPPKYPPARFLRHTDYLAGPELEGRGLGGPGLEEAAQYIADQFRAAGLRPIDGAYQHRWRESLAGVGEVELSNVLGLLPGVNEELAARPIVIGAHYDHVGVQDGQIHPGADRQRIRCRGPHRGRHQTGAGIRSPAPHPFRRFHGRGIGPGSDHSALCASLPAATAISSP